MLADTIKRSQTVLGLVTLSVVLLAAIPLGANRPAGWTILALIVIALFTVQLILDLVGVRSPQGAKLWLPAFLYLGVVCWGISQVVSGFLPEFASPVWARVDVEGRISADPGQGRHMILRLVTYAMVFWIALRSAQDRDGARRLMALAAIYCTALALFGLWAFFSGTNPVLGDSASLTTVTATFPNRNTYATYAMMGLVLNLALYMRMVERAAAQGGRRKRLRDTLEGFFAGGWLYGLGLIVGLGAVALSQSRAGAAATLIGLSAFVMIYARRRNGVVGPAVLLSLLAIVGFVAFTASGGLVERLLTADTENARFLIFPHVVDGILDRPLTGHGLGSFRDTFRAYVPVEAAFGEWDMAHNSWLENAWDLGLPAALAFYAAIFLVLARLLRAAIFRKNDRHFAAMGLAIAIAGGFHALFDFSFQIPAVTALFAFLLAIAYAQSFGERELARARKATG